MVLYRGNLVSHVNGGSKRFGVTQWPNSSHVLEINSQIWRTKRPKRRGLRREQFPSWRPLARRHCGGRGGRLIHGTRCLNGRVGSGRQQLGTVDDGRLGEIITRTQSTGKTPSFFGHSKRRLRGNTGFWWLRRANDDRVKCIARRKVDTGYRRRFGGRTVTTKANLTTAATTWGTAR